MFKTWLNRTKNIHIKYDIILATIIFLKIITPIYMYLVVLTASNKKLKREISILKKQQFKLATKIWDAN